MAKRPTTTKTPTRKTTTKRASGSGDAAKKPATRSRKTVRPATEAPMQRRARAEVAVSEPSAEQIAARAYELFAARGYAHGHHEEDWLRAEAELRARV